MMAGATVKVLRPKVVGTDSFGADVVEWVPEFVDNVLTAPQSTADLGAERPDGDETRIRVHFPRSYEASLRGCRVEAYGRTWAVVGDPLKLDPRLCPLPWDRMAEAVRVDG